MYNLEDKTVYLDNKGRSSHITSQKAQQIIRETKADEHPT